MKERSRTATVILWALQGLAVVAFLTAGVLKLTGAAPMIQLFDAIGMGQWFRYVTGAIEVGSALLVLVPSRAVLGAFLLACTMTGAILAHLFILHTSPIAPLALLIVVGLVIWLRRDQIASWLGGTPRATGQGAA